MANEPPKLQVVGQLSDQAIATIARLLLRLAEHE
jgi:hypothetical protein